MTVDDQPGGIFSLAYFSNSLALLHFLQCVGQRLIPLFPVSVTQVSWGGQTELGVHEALAWFWRRSGTKGFGQALAFFQVGREEPFRLDGYPGAIQKGGQVPPRIASWRWVVYKSMA